MCPQLDTNVGNKNTSFFIFDQNEQANRLEDDLSSTSIVVGEYFKGTQSHQELNDVQIIREFKCNTDGQEFLVDDTQFE